LRVLIAEQAWVPPFDSREGSRRYGFVSFTKEVCVRSSEYVFEGSFKSFIYSTVIVFCIETTSSNVSLYRIDFTGVTNRLRLASKRLVSKRPGSGTRIPSHPTFVPVASHQKTLLNAYEKTDSRQS